LINQNLTNRQATNTIVFKTEKIKWNFTKFLVNKDGEPVNRYGSSTTPEQIETDIEKLINS